MTSWTTPSVREEKSRPVTLLLDTEEGERRSLGRDYPPLRRRVPSLVTCYSDLWTQDWSRCHCGVFDEGQRLKTGETGFTLQHGLLRSLERDTKTVRT